MRARYFRRNTKLNSFLPKHGNGIGFRCSARRTHMQIENRRKKQIYTKNVRGICETHESWTMVRVSRRIALRFVRHCECVCVCSIAKTEKEGKIKWIITTTIPRKTQTLSDIFFLFSFAAILVLSSSSPLLHHVCGAEGRLSSNKFHEHKTDYVHVNDNPYISHTIFYFILLHLKCILSPVFRGVPFKVLLHVENAKHDKRQTSTYTIRSSNGIRFNGIIDWQPRSSKCLTQNHEQAMCNERLELETAHYTLHRMFSIITKTKHWHCQWHYGGTSSIRT